MNRSTKRILRAAVFTPAVLLFAVVGGSAHADGVGGSPAAVVDGPLKSITGQGLPALPLVPGLSRRAAGLPIDPAVLRPTASEIAGGATPAMLGKPGAVDDAVPGPVKDAVPAGLGDAQIPGGQNATFGGLPGPVTGALPGSAH